MKKFLCLVAVAALAACSESATEEPDAQDTTAVAEAPAPATPMSLDGQPSFGTFRATDEDGAVSTIVVNEDGTFTATDAAGETATGTWTEETPGRFCETIDGTETCYTETMENGVWTSTGPDGKKSTIERVVE